jgi:hypothetical protein
MAHLIVGHVTCTTAHVWVHDEDCFRCRVTLRAEPRHASGSTIERYVHIDRKADRTALVVFHGLTPGTDYNVYAAFPGQMITGRFATLADTPAGDGAVAFSFVLASCNLPVVAVNNLLSLLLTMGGAFAARLSFDLHRRRWKLPSPLAPPLRWLGKSTLWIAGAVLRVGTGAKQPPPPYLRSPFLKVSAVFDAWIIDLGEAPYDTFPVVGDLLRTDEAEGVVVSLEKTRLPHPPEANRLTQDRGTCRLVLTEATGRFEISQRLVVDGRPERRFTIAGARRTRPWFSRPAFFIHAGDQIYYDVPFPDRPPARKEYRRSYHEAWFDDASARHVLSHWPHYMTLDDHEIADQYAEDFHSPNEDVPPTVYLREALAAYREYVAVRHPRPDGRWTPSPNGGPYWYCFSHGRARFFVLDTRTRRNNGRGEIVDAEQLHALLRWLSESPRDNLKFVVTSVPFVAEFDEAVVQEERRWADTVRPGTRRNAENDKWSAERFRGQRNRIIEHIHDHRIDHVVFLTGDMHCCYHARMRIGTGTRYQSVVVHELAGGPMNQLQLPNASEFCMRRTGRTEGGGGGNAVAYEVTLERFHSHVSAVLHLRVDYVPHDAVCQTDGRPRPRVEWNVIRTLTDIGPSGWRDEDRASSAHPGEVALGGRLDFARRRTLAQLRRW